MENQTITLLVQIILQQPGQSKFLKFLMWPKIIKQMGSMLKI